MHMHHPFLPFYNADSKILILGSFPSVASREGGFYYHYPHNRFWKVLSTLTHSSLPNTIEEKKDLLSKYKIALWDVIEQCSIKGSSDASIHDVKVSDIQTLLEKSSVERIFANGKTAGKLYEKWCEPFTCKAITTLPSTSPANATFDLEKLIRLWQVIL